jgi:hypothetical protein
MRQEEHMKAFLATTSSLLVLALAAPAAGQSRGGTVPCLNRTAAIKHLGKKFAETPVASGLTNNGAVLEVLTSKTGGNWTIMVTLPNGTACMIAAGRNWEKIPFVKILGPKA